jgi:hypothetical protein
LCRGILAFCRSRAIHGGTAHPAAVLLDMWLEDDVPTFEWVYSEETLVVYETVLRRLALASRFVDRVIGTIRQMGTTAAPPFGVGDSASAMEEVFCAAAEAAEEASIVTPDPARFPDTGRIRVVSPVEAVAEMSGHARYAERAAGIPASERPIDPIVQRWPT